MILLVCELQRDNLYQHIMNVSVCVLINLKIIDVKSTLRALPWWIKSKKWNKILLLSMYIKSVQLLFWNTLV